MILVKNASNSRTPDRLEWTVICLGVSSFFIGQNFVLGTHFLLGDGIRYVIAAAIFALVFAHAKTIYHRLTHAEKIVILLVGGISLIALTNSFALGMVPDLFYFSKLVLLNISIYLLAKLIPEQDLLEKCLRFIYYIACIASIQGALTVAMDIGEFYYIGETVIKGIGGSGDIIFPFWGLIGSHVFMRAFWYFSESAYFAQFLMIALGYAIATRRHLGIAFLTIGILSSFAVGSMIATLIMLLAVTLSSRGKLATPVATIFATLFICYLLVGNIYLKRSSEGMTTTVLSAPLIEDIKAQKLKIESYTDQIKSLQESLDYHHLTPQKKYEIEGFIKTLHRENDILSSNMLGNH